jgi:1-acyl-sn-glycerol-3-phosphate acyltransferase
MWHLVVRSLARRALAWRYGDIEIAGHSIPLHGPALLLANHGNDLPDVLLTFLVAPPSVRLVGNVAAAASCIVRWTYNGLGVIPIARVRDARALKARGQDPAMVNQRGFAEANAALQQGDVLAMFPEGVVPDRPQLGPVRGGAARIANAFLTNAAGATLRIIPVGFQYERPFIPRSAVLVLVGAPIPLVSIGVDEPAAALTASIRDALHRITRNASTIQRAEFIAHVAAMTGAANSTHAVSPLLMAHCVQRTLPEGFQESSRAPLNETAVSPATACTQRMRTALELLSHYVHEGAPSFRAVGVRPWSARDHALALVAAGDTQVTVQCPSFARTALVTPFALLGWVWHAVPFKACYVLGQRLAPRPSEVAARVIVPGLYLILVWYVSIPLLLLYAGVPRLLVAALFLAQPSLGDVAWKWRDAVRDRRVVRAVGRATPANRERMREAAVLLRRAWYDLQAAS